MVLAYKNDAPIRVRDIGLAGDAPENVKVAGAEVPTDNTIITKQPGANVIDTVDRIKAALPRLQEAIPPTVHINTLIDRTQTIHASVADVEFTMVLTIALVILVIFLFLLNVPATLVRLVSIFALAALLIFSLIGSALYGVLQRELARHQQDELKTHFLDTQYMIGHNGDPSH